MRALSLTVLSLGIVLHAAYHPGSDSPTSLPCLVPGAESADRISTIKENLASSDSGAILWRTGFGMVGVDSASLLVVADTLVCTAVTRSVDSAFHKGTSTEAYLVVLRAGPRYVSFAPSGQSQSLFITDTNYVFKFFVP